MRLKFLSVNVFLAVSLGVSVGGVQAATPGPPSFAANYQLVFNQDFTAMSTLSQLGVSASTIGTGAWVAHTPTNQDYFTFENPTANYKPFGVGAGYLTIRVQQDGNDPNNWFDGFSGGLLSSMDSSGAGFAQKYGYFECSAWTPGTPNTWPAFWLISSPNLTNGYLPFMAEIDVMEAYGNYQTGPNQMPPGNPNSYSVAWHDWGKNGNPTTQNGLFLNESGLTTGFHTYGVDVEPNGISWYFDRQLVWQAPIFPAAQQPLLAMVNLALGGGNYNNAGGTGYNWALTPNPTDLKVQYVAVWASPYSPNYLASAIPAAPTGLAATGGNAQVALTWNASSGATSYNILRSTSSGSETILASGIAEAAYTDATVSSGVTYFYQVSAVNTLGASGASNEASGASTGPAATVAIPGAPTFGSNYQLVFSQDFTTMTSLSQLGVSASTMGSGTWIAHTPTNQDFFTFENPTANYQPFGVGNGYLDIRVQQDGNDPHNWFSGYSGGLLSSLDSNGAGFAQKYGYFECSLWTPGSPNTWPAFWLLSAPNITNSSLPNLAEIDIMESYGNYQAGANQTPTGNPNAYSVAWHNWGENGTATTQDGGFFSESGMTTSYHTYGVDVEPTGISWYFDRQLVWQAPIFPAAQQPLLVMVDLALGGGDYNNATGTGYNWLLTPDPTDLKVQYVAVWASPNSPNYTGSSVPSAPTGLSAVGGSGQIALTWTASAGATTYNIVRGTTSGGETALVSGVASTSYTDTTATSGTYYYEVKAVNSSGISTASAEVSATATATGTAPAVPAGLSATAGNAQVRLAWTSSTGATSYNVLRGNSAGSETVLTTGLASASYVDNAVGNGTTYYYQIVAVNGFGTSGRSNEVSATPAAPGVAPSAPAGLSATGGTAQVTLAWSASSGAAGYNVLRGTSSGSETVLAAGISSASYTDNAVINGTTYYYEIAAVNGFGTSGNSNEARATPTAAGAAPSAPTGLSAIGGSAQVTLAWRASSSANGYNVLRGTSSGSETVLTTGITSASYTDNAVTNGTRYYYEITAVNAFGTSGNSNEASATPAAAVSSGPLPSPWLNQDIGNTWKAGSSTYAAGTFTLNGAGNGAFYLPDRFQFAYQPVTGDCSIIARVATQANSNRYAEAGVMIRDGLANNAGFADTILYPGNGGALFQYRGDSGSPGSFAGSGTAPYWVRITRAGNIFTSAVSADGVTWAPLGSMTLTMPSTVYIGLVQASGIDGTLSTATFDNVSVTSSTGGGIAAPPTGLSATDPGGQITLAWAASPGAVSYNVLRSTSPNGEAVLVTGINPTSYVDNAVDVGTTYYYEVQSVNGSGVSGPSNEASATAQAPTVAPLPAPWLSQDVGPTLAAGSSSYANSIFTLTGAGSGPYYVPDRFQFAYQLASGDCSIVTRVTAQANSNHYAHAGVIIRDNLGDTGAFVDVTLYPNGGGTLFQYRADTGYPATISGAPGTAPYWVQLSRSGNTFTGSVSPDGITWTTLGSITVAMPSTVYIGLLQASGINGTLATSTFDNVTVTP